MKHQGISRREFIKTTAALAGTTMLASCSTKPAVKSPVATATDQVTLGKTGLKLSRLGFGTGAEGGRTIVALGSESTARLIHYAYDHGITYFDTAENYRTHALVGAGIKGLPREKLFIQTKMPRVPDNPLEVLDRYRKELGVEYIDSLLMHCMTEADWDRTHKSVMDALEEAKAKKIILAHGVSCHSLGAVETSAKQGWVDVNLVRVNPQAVCTDTPGGGWLAPSNKTDLAFVLDQVKIMRKNGHGIIGMKLIGNGEFKNAEDREISIRFAMQSGLLDAAVIGFKSTEEIDEAIQRINRALAERA
jgi:hypothetical protein